MAQFAMPWRFPQEVAEPGALPTPTNEIFADFDAATQGVGTRASPYNDLPGQSAGDARVGFGTRVTCKGTLRSSVANFGQLLRGGAPSAPVVYVGNDPSWGNATIDGSAPLASAACTNQANAFGNPNWASMRRAALTSGNNADDYLHCLYGGPDRDIRYLSGYPQLSNNSAFDYNLFITPASLVDIYWYPGINESSPDFVVGQSRPRLSLAAADSWLVANSPGYVAGALAAAMDTDSAPILQMRVRPNQWFTARAGRCDADGTANANGAYITVIDGQRMSLDNTGWPDDPYTYDMFKFRILNLAKAVDRAGTYAMNPVAGWLVEWPFGTEQLYRAQGKSGLEIAAEYVWVHGFKICGMSTSNTVADITGAGGGRSLTASSINSNTIRVQRNFFPAFGSVGPKSRNQAYISCGHAQVYYNTLKRQAVGSAIFATDGSGGRFKFNHMDYIHGSNLRFIGAHMRDVLIGGNLIEHCNDIHGNGITMYIAKYGVIVEFNVVRDTGRPLTTELNNAYNPAYGAPSTIVRNNTFLASGEGTAFALRFQGAVEQGMSALANKLDGGPAGHPPFGANPAINTALNGPVSGNTGVGAAITGTALTLWNAGGGNTFYTRASTEGAALVAAWATEGLDPVYAPKGAGYTAGGWDGKS